MSPGCSLCVFRFSLQRVGAEICIRCCPIQTERKGLLRYPHSTHPLPLEGESQGTSHHRTSVLPGWGGVVARRQRRKRARSHSQCLRPNWTTHPNGNSRVMEPSARLLLSVWPVLLYWKKGARLSPHLWPVGRQLGTQERPLCAAAGL